ncbi:hypothetical protein E8E11_011824 [Didymella keratinophila]|nr:hypothetical protein E8E11_011824 [Didymella keratinophila]
MKPFAAVTFIAFAASATGRAIRAPTLSTAVTTSSILPASLHLHELQFNNASSSAPPVFVAGDPWDFGSDDDEEDAKDLTPEQKDAIWCKAKSRGSQLTKTMMLNDQEAAITLQWPYTQSPWDGDLKPELKKWGYKEINSEMNTRDMDIDGQCAFDKTHELGDAFQALNVDPRPAGKGGPNHCFYVEHMNGPTVIPDQDGTIPTEDKQYYEADGKKYRVTQAYAKVGVNANDGVVYFIHRESPEHTAETYWKRKPNANELPALRASSDIVWAVMWNRVAQGSRKLNYFMSVSVINTESEVIMERIMQHFNMAAVPPWPGRDFEFAVKGSNPSDDDLAEMEAALALLGSPNGIGAGYFLIQHRRQLGWKYIWKVKVWMSGEDEWAEPNILFYVSDHAPIAGPREFDDQLNRLHISQKRKRDLVEAAKRSVVVHKSEDGKSVIREHRMAAKL